MIIMFSGIDGSGKTAMTTSVAKRLSETVFDAEVCEPRYLANEAMLDFASPGIAIVAYTTQSSILPCTCAKRSSTRSPFRRSSSANMKALSSSAIAGLCWTFCHRLSSTSWTCPISSTCV